MLSERFPLLPVPARGAQARKDKASSLAVTLVAVQRVGWLDFRNESRESCFFFPIQFDRLSAQKLQGHGHSLPQCLNTR